DVDDEDRFRLRRDRSRDGTRIEAKSLVDFCEYRYCACEQHRLKIGHECKRGKNDFIAGSDPASRQCRTECGRATGTDMCISRIQPLRQSLLEFARLPLTLPGRVEPVAHQHAGVEHLQYFASLFFADQFESRHWLPRVNVCVVPIL